MDYGKLAYLRIEELENTLAKTPAARQKSTAFVVCPKFPLREGNDYTAIRFAGNDALTAVIKMSVDVVQSGRIGLFLDGKKLEFCDFDRAGHGEHISLLTMKVDGAGVVALRAEKGFSGYLTALSVALIGGDAAVTGERGVFAADESDGICAYLFHQDERIYLTVVREHYGEQQRNEVEVGYGGIADLCAARVGGFYVAYTDHSNNMWLLRVSGSGAATRIRIGSGATSVAVFDTGSNSIVLAFVRDRRAYFVTVDYNFSSISSECAIETDTKPDAVAFVKNAVLPTLILSADGKVFVRFTIPEYGNTEVFTARFSAGMSLI